MVVTTSGTRPGSGGAFARSGGWRAVTRLVCAFALILQMLAPAAARNGEGSWIEICAEFGPVMMQVDLTGDQSTPDQTCPDCQECALCALSASGPLPVKATGPDKIGLCAAQIRPDLNDPAPQRRYERFLIRDPPVAPLATLDHAQPASPPQPKGGERWS